MKKHIFSIASAACLVWLAPLFFSLNLAAQTTNHDHENGLAHDEPEHVCRLSHEDFARKNQDVPLASAQIETPEVTVGAPSIQATFEPQENGAIIYETVAGWLGGQSPKAQITIKNSIKNIGNASITLNKVVYTYVQNGVTKNKTFNLNPTIPIAVNEWKSWQNGRDYHEVGDVLYLDSPFPASITIKFYFVGSNTPIQFVKPLAAYNTTFGMPFRAFDLASNEVWQGGSTHGGGSQVFAYDLSVQGLENGTWTYSLPGTDGSQNDDSRTWGQPIYAMADGVVEEFLNTDPNNPAPGQLANFSSGGGNHFKIIHGTHEALYAHMIQGSLNSDLMQVGAVVKKGDFLGLAGNSGNSTGPHLHIHIVKLIDGEAVTPCRPLLFNEGWTIQKTSFTTLSNTANWFKLTAHGLPGYAGTRAFIWPSNSKPQYNDNVYTSVYRTGTGSYALWTGATSAAIATKNTELMALGLRMIDLSVVKEGSSLKYSGVWRAGTGSTVLQTGTTWASFNTQWVAQSNAGKRLLDIEIFKDANGNLKYAGVYGDGAWGHYLYVGKTQAEFNALWSSLGGQGYRLVDVEVYNYNGQTYYAGIWKAGSGGYALWHASSWANFTTKWDELSDGGYRLIDLDTDNTGANTIYSGVFTAGNDGYYLWQSNYNSSISKWEHLSERGLRLLDFNVRPSSGSTLDDDGGVAEREMPEETLLVGPQPFEGAKNTEAAAFALSVFPNPVSDVLTLETEAEILAWSLSNALGQTVAAGENADSASQLSIPVSTLRTGVYQLTIRTAAGSATKKVEVQR